MSRPSYDHVLDGESEDDQHSILLDDEPPLGDESTPTHSKTKFYVATIILIIPLVFLITPLTRTLSHAFKSSPDGPSPSHHPPLDLEDCGLTPTSARQSNCIFDPILMGWVPLRCHDLDLASEFLSRQKVWGMFYRDEDHNSTMPLEEVMTGEWEYVYVTWELQVLHCMYSWKKTLRAAMGGSGGGVMLDGYVGDDHHTNHCEMWMLKGREEMKELEVYMKFVGCPRERGRGSERGEVGRFGWYRVLGGKKIYRNE